MEEGTKMNKFTQKIVRFMMGRYGMDELYIGLLVGYILVMFVNAFAKSFLLNVLGTAMLVWGLYRFLSKKHDARRKENEVFLKLWRPVRNWLTYCRDRIRDRKTARYRKCKHCKAIVKLPVKKGKHTVVCPKCGKRFDVRI